MAVFGGVTGQIISAIRVRRGWHCRSCGRLCAGARSASPSVSGCCPARSQSLQAGARRHCWSCAVRRCWRRLDCRTSRDGGRAGRCGCGTAGRNHGAVERVQRPGPRALVHAARLHQGRAPRGPAELQPDQCCRRRSFRSSGPAVSAGEHAAANGDSRRLPGRAVGLGLEIYIGMSPAAFRKAVLWLLVFAGVTRLDRGFPRDPSRAIADTLHAWHRGRLPRADRTRGLPSTSNRRVCSSNGRGAATPRPSIACSPGSGLPCSGGRAAGCRRGLAIWSIRMTLSRIPSSRR